MTEIQRGFRIVSQALDYEGRREPPLSPTKNHFTTPREALGRMTPQAIWQAVAQAMRIAAGAATQPATVGVASRTMGGATEAATCRVPDRIVSGTMYDTTVRTIHETARQTMPQIAPRTMYDTTVRTMYRTTRGVVPQAGVSS